MFHRNKFFGVCRERDNQMVRIYPNIYSSCLKIRNDLVSFKIHQQLLCIHEECKENKPTLIQRILLKVMMTNQDMIILTIIIIILF